jgi:hypothetical protein
MSFRNIFTSFISALVFLTASAQGKDSVKTLKEVTVRSIYLGVTAVF